MLSRPPASLAGVHERPGGPAQVGVPAEEVGHLRLGDHRRQAVGADEVDVAGLRPPGHVVDHDVALVAQRARDDRPLRVLVGLCGVSLPSWTSSSTSEVVGA
jgi:hypothetical protein